MRSGFYLSGLIVLILGSFLHAQNPVPSALPPLPQPLSQLPPPVADVVVGAPGSDSFFYDPTGKRDPFHPVPTKEEEAAPNATSPEATTSGAPEVTRDYEPLESYDVAQLKISAIIWNTKNPRALIADPQGGTHTVRVKSRIGKRNGFVAAIREGEIVVVEYVMENDRLTKSFRVLELR